MRNIHSPNYLILLVFGLLFFLFRQIKQVQVNVYKYIIIALAAGYFTLNSISKLSGNDFKLSGGLIGLTIIGILSGIISGLLTKISKGEDGKAYQQGGRAVIIIALAVVPIPFIIRMFSNTLSGSAILNNVTVSILLLISTQIISRLFIILLRMTDILKLSSKRKTI
jgi:hypothetical protein